MQLNKMTSFFNPLESTIFLDNIMRMLNTMNQKNLSNLSDQIVSMILSNRFSLIIINTWFCIMYASQISFLIKHNYQLIPTMILFSIAIVISHILLYIKYSKNKKKKN